VSLAYSRRQGVDQAEISFVQRAPNDNSHHSGFEPGPKSTDVIETRDAAGSDYREAHGIRNFLHPRCIDTDLRSIASDVGHDCGRDPSCAESIPRVGDSYLAGLDPSFDG
jgi:hypothetical protein